MTDQILEKGKLEGLLSIALDPIGEWAELEQGVFEALGELAKEIASDTDRKMDKKQAEVVIPGDKR